MTKEYEISDKKFDKAKSKILSSGGSIDSCSFSVKGVSGFYEYEDGSLFIQINDKPFLASWKTISNGLDGFFE